MSEFVIPVAPPVSVPVVGSSKRFPVRRIYCVGRNYLEHIREMGGDERAPPFFFQKPTDAIVLDGASIPYPTITEDFQFEVELVLAIGKGGDKIAEADSASHVFGLAVGIDLTRRDVQIKARNTGRPWEIGKSFDHSAPIGSISPLRGELPTRGKIELRVGSETRQSGDLSQLIWNCAEIISQLSRQYRLEPGDLIYTGTPAGVGAVRSGESMLATVQGLPALTVSVA